MKTICGKMQCCLLAFQQRDVCVCVQSCVTNLVTIEHIEAEPCDSKHKPVSTLLAVFETKLSSIF